MHKEVRHIVDEALKFGWRLEGTDGRDHYVLRHANGERYRIAGTPGDVRNRVNALAHMRRIAGVKNTGPNAAHHRHVKGSGYRPVKSDNEKLVARQIELKKLDLDILDAHLAVLLARPPHERDEALARDIVAALTKRDAVAEWLREKFQPVPKRPVPKEATAPVD